MAQIQIVKMTTRKRKEMTIYRAPEARQKMMKSAISHKSEATVISGRTENTKEAPLRNIDIGEIGRRGRRRDPIA